ncbi:unnamed protein product [Gongylonema pulchrum]|nr:unnamed protein product [Gongylonema pulchrum]
MGAPPGWLPPLPNSFGPPSGPFPPFLPPPPPWMGASPAPPGSFPLDPASSGAARVDGAEGEDEEEGGEYSHYYKEWEEKQRRGHREVDAEDSEIIPEGAMAHWLAPGPPGWAPPPNWGRHSHRHSPSANNFIDHQTRKALPAWIREGLEKAEQEKQKRLIREAKMKAAEEAAKARRAAKGLGKFDSDSSEDENENGRGSGKFDGEPIFRQKRNEEKEQESNVVEETEEVDYRTEDEKREDAVSFIC